MMKKWGLENVTDAVHTEDQMSRKSETNLMRLCKWMAENRFRGIVKEQTLLGAKKDKGMVRTMVKNVLKEQETQKKKKKNMKMMKKK